MTMQQFTDEQQSLIAAYWLLCDAQPPSKGEMFTARQSLASEATEGYLVDAFSKALFEVRQSTFKYANYPYDNFRRGTGLPGHRKVRAS